MDEQLKEKLQEFEGEFEQEYILKVFAFVSCFASN
jgi:hypothetical protein